MPVGFDPTPGGGSGVVRVYLVTDVLHWEDVALPTPFGFATQPALGTVFATASTAGAVHLCAPTATTARRYIVTPDRKSVLAGGECGPMVGGPRILTARRDPAQLLPLDATTGKVTRTLPLAGGSSSADPLGRPYSLSRSAAHRGSAHKVFAR